MRVRLLLLSFLLSFDLHASTFQGTITKVTQGPLYGPLVFIKIQGTSSDIPMCWTNGTFNYVVDTCTVAGRNTLALILFAKANAQSVTVSGYGTCSQYQGVEDLRYLALDT